MNRKVATVSGYGIGAVITKGNSRSRLRVEGEVCVDKVLLNQIAKLIY